MQVKEEELLCLMCLGAYVLLLGRCCRGWGAEEAATGGRRERGAEPRPTPDMTEKRTLSSQAQGGQRPVRDPLQQYKVVRGSEAAIVVPGSPARRKSRATMGGKLDLGSFLIGVEVSLRHSHPKMTQGLFGPLTNGEWLYCTLCTAVVHAVYCMSCAYAGGDSFVPLQTWVFGLT